MQDMERGLSGLTWGIAEAHLRVSPERFEWSPSECNTEDKGERKEAS